MFGLNALLFLLLGLQFPAIVDDARAGDSFGTLLLDGAGARRGGGGDPAVVRVPAVHAHGRRLARAARDRLERHARRDLARRRAVGARDRRRPPDDPVRDVRRDPRHARRPGPDAARAAARLRLQGERQWTPDEAIARLEAAQSALDRLDELEDEGTRRARSSCGACASSTARASAPARPCSAAATRTAPATCARAAGATRDLRRELIGVERAALLGLRNEGKLRPDVQRLIQRDLDLEEARLT